MEMCLQEWFQPWLPESQDRKGALDPQLGASGMDFVFLPIRVGGRIGAGYKYNNRLQSYNYICQEHREYIKANTAGKQSRRTWELISSELLEQKKQMLLDFFLLD